MAWELAPPSWEAAATLVTGGAAVFAAFIVGARQTAIARRQADIQAEQTRAQSQMAEIERVRLRMEMFNRRHDVYGATFDYLGHFLMTSTAPRLIQYDGEEVSEEEFELARRFRDACHVAPFIFRPEVDSLLKEIREASRKLSRAKRKQKKLEGNPGPQMTAAIKQEEEAATTLEGCDSRLVQVFGPEMRLAEPEPESAEATQRQRKTKR